MNIRVFNSLSLVSILLCAPQAAQAREGKEGDTPSPAEFFIAEAHPDSGLSPARFSFRVGDDLCTVEPDGKAVCAGKATQWRFSMPTDDGGTIEKVYVFARDRYLLLAYELTDFEANWARLVRVDRGSRTPKWRIEVRGLNLAVPLVRESSVFVAALTFVAAVNVESGNIEWSHQVAYDRSGRTYTQVEVIADKAFVRVSDLLKPENTVTSCYETATGAYVQCPVR